VDREQAVAHLHAIASEQLLGSYPGLVERLSGDEEHTLPAQLVDGAVGDEPTASDDTDPIADLLHLAEQVAGQQDGPPSGAEAADQVTHVGEARGVETVGRLVEDQQLGVLEEGGRYAEPLLHAQRVRREAIAGAVGELHHVETIGDALARCSHQSRQDAQVVPAGQVGVERRPFDERTDTGETLGMPGRVTEHRCRSARGTDEAQQHAQGARLAGTIRPEEAIYLPAPHLERQPIDGDPFPAERLGEVMGLDHAVGFIDDGGEPRTKRLSVGHPPSVVVKRLAFVRSGTTLRLRFSTYPSYVEKRTSSGRSDPYRLCMTGTTGARRPVFRVTVGDALLAAAVAAAMAVGSPQAALEQVPPRQALDLLAWVLMGLSAAALLARRTWPQTTLAVTTACLAGYLLAGYPYGPALFPLLVALYSVGDQLLLRYSLRAAGASIAVLLVVIGVEGDPQGTVSGLTRVVASAGFLVAPWTIGVVVRGRRRAEGHAGEQAGRRDADRDRMHLSQEVHDVVGHALAAINMQAGIALHVRDRRPEQAYEALEAIKSTSKQALDELRRTLVVARTPVTGATAPAPTPGLRQLPELVGRTAQSGLPVHLEVTGNPYDVPSAVDLAGYRIVQESLTNALRHAHAPAATVLVGYTADAVVVEVTDQGSGPTGSTVTTGRGIAGMRERASALGGTLEAGPGPEGGFRVRAELPVAGATA
jgi:signal transduction histidine kinase